jgi:hypothetical protein
MRPAQAIFGRRGRRERDRTADDRQEVITRPLMIRAGNDVSLHRVLVRAISDRAMRCEWQFRDERSISRFLSVQRFCGSIRIQV